MGKKEPLSKGPGSSFSSATKAQRPRVLLPRPVGETGCLGGFAERSGTQRDHHHCNLDHGSPLHPHAQSLGGSILHQPLPLLHHHHLSTLPTPQLQRVTFFFLFIKNKSHGYRSPQIGSRWSPSRESVVALLKCCYVTQQQQQQQKEHKAKSKEE